MMKRISHSKDTERRNPSAGEIGHISARSIAASAIFEAGKTRKTKTTLLSLVSPHATFEARPTLDCPEFDQNVKDLMIDVSNSKYTLNEIAHFVSAYPDRTSFSGLSKKELLLLLDIIQTLQISRKQHLKNNIAYHHAIYALHHDAGLAPSTIRQIFGFFEIEISNTQILNSSDKIMRMGIIPSWINRIERAWRESK